jgi:Domain of unknown function (DUF5615)
MFLAEENVESAIVVRFRSDGYDVLRIDGADSGTSDDCALTIAEEQACLPITVDTEFGELVLRHGPRASRNCTATARRATS